MANYKKDWCAIVVAYRKEETDLDATIKSAAESAGKGVKIITVEDKDNTGPGWNRHRGIEAAADSEVIILIDAHMRFKGDVLRRMAKQVKDGGGLLTPLCHHNAECSFDAKTTSGKHYYAGARIVYRAQDGAHKTALAAKWARDTKPGPRAAMMGACYAFRRDWYYNVGQPLSILRGWGCDEELLSISAWLSGTMPEVIDGHVAHLYRAAPPWKVSSWELEAVGVNRRTMVSLLATDTNDRRELLSWQGGGPMQYGPECERFRQAMLRQPRKWREWLKEVCEPDEINGAQSAKPSSAKTTPSNPVSLTPRNNPVVPRAGLRCPHCGTIKDKVEVTHTYPNGNRRHKCGECGNPFVSVFRATS